MPSHNSRFTFARPAGLAVAALSVGMLYLLAAATRTSAVESQSEVAQVASAPAQAVLSVSITVSNLDASIDWYTNTLDFTLVDRRTLDPDRTERLFATFGATAQVARLALGDEFIELIEFSSPSGRPMPPDSAGNDRWFQHIAIVVRDMPLAYERLRAARVRHASSAPQRLPDWNPNAGGIEAFYFRDPDGHFLEVIYFPMGKGDPRWQRSTDRLFLGIDHTAIVVADTERSLKFYRDSLGLRIAGASENYGMEQEHLNAVFGARLRITTLKAQSGPGVELLEYLAPARGRAMPEDSRAVDLWHWHANVSVPDAAQLMIPVRSGGGATVSAWAVDADLPTESCGDALLVRDPDGHALLLVEHP